MQKRNLKGRFLPTHGAYKKIKPLKFRRYLTAIRRGLVEDLGPSELDLSMAQIILIDRVVSLLGVVISIEEHCKETGIFKDGDLAPSLRQSYLAYNNSVRLNLQALGIQRKESESFDVHEYVRKKYGKKEESDGKK